MIRLPKTFQEVINEYGEDEVFPIEIDDALRGTIIKWFGYRRICVLQPERFIIFFQRVLLENYLRYREMLRIEPGIAHFDWLVETYRELQNTRLATISDEEIAVLSGTVTGQTTGTKNGSVVTDGDIKETIANTKTHNLQVVDDETVEHGGADETEATSTKTNNLETDTEYQNLKDTTEYQKKSKVSNDGSDNVLNGASHAELKKSGPMSVSYNTDPVSMGALVTSGTQQGEKIGDLNFKYADSQGVANDNSEQKTVYNSSVTTEDLANSKDVNTRTGHEVRKDTGTVGDVSDKTTQYGHTVDRDLKRATTGTIADNGSHDKDINQTVTTTETTGGTSSETTNGRNTKNNDQSIDDLIRERMTGRQTEIAKILKNAVSYISTTDSWRWLKEHLEPCFYGTFTEDDYE